MGKRRGKDKQRGKGKQNASVVLGKHDKEGVTSTIVDKSPRKEEIHEVGKNEHGAVAEQFEEVIQVVGDKEMTWEEYEEVIIEVDADEEISEEFEEIVEVEVEEPTEEEVEDVEEEEPFEVEEQIEDVDKKTIVDEEPTEREQVEGQSADAKEESDNEEFNEEQSEYDLQELDNEVDEEPNEEIEEEPIEQEQVEEVIVQDKSTSSNKEQCSEGQATERLSSKVPSEPKGYIRSPPYFCKPISDNNIAEQKSYNFRTFSSQKNVSADVSQIKQESSKIEQSFGKPVIAVNSSSRKITCDGESSDNQGADISSSKKKRTRWDSQSESHPDACEVGDELVRKRKSRWSSEQNPVKVPDLLEIPHFLYSDDIIIQDPEIQKLVEALKNIYNEFLKVTGVEGSRSNEATVKHSLAEVSLRANFVKQKQKIFSLLLKKGFDFKSLLGGTNNKNGKYVKKIYVPVSKYPPDYNFIGLFVGPRGNNHKRMELESGAKLKLRGKGSTKDGKSVKDTSDPSEDEDLHVIIEADNQESLNSAAKMVEKLLIPVAETENELKRAQLKELAALKRRIAPCAFCEVCGDGGHYTGHCPLISGAPGATGHPVKGLTKVGARLFSTSKSDQINGSSRGQLIMGGPGDKKIDDRKLFVGQLPFSVDDKCLSELFGQYGELRDARVIKDVNTGVSQRYAFVKYRYPADAAKAVQHMHGFQLEGRALIVQVSGLSTKTPPGPDRNKTSGHQKASQNFFAVPQLSPIPTSRPVAISFPGSSTPVQHHISSLSTKVQALRSVNSSYLASTVHSVATTYNSTADLVNFAGNPDKLPSPFSIQLGKPSSGIFCLEAASAPRHLAASGSHVYPSRTAAVGSKLLVTPPIAANRLPPLGRPYLAAPPSESSNFPGNPDSFRSRFL